MKTIKHKKNTTSKQRLPSFFKRLYGIGLILAATAFVFALTPSLIPRDGMLQ